MPDVGTYSPTFTELAFHAAVNYLGMPYEAMGDNNRLDCSQLVVNVFRSLGFAIPDMRATDFRDQLFTLPNPPETGPKLGAIFRREDGKVVHIGLLGPSGTIVIHATQRDGRVVVKALDKVEYTEVMYLDVVKLMDYYTRTIRMSRTPGPASS
jgi:hypothetical protein